MANLISIGTVQTPVYLFLPGIPLVHFKYPVVIRLKGLISTIAIPTSKLQCFLFIPPSYFKYDEHAVIAVVLCLTIVVVRMSLVSVSSETG